jgi:hypothetical protein
MPRLSLADLLEQPSPSPSPIRPSLVFQTPPVGDDEDEDDEDLPSLSQARKRPRKDYTDFAKQMSCRVRFKAANEQVVIDFSKVMYLCALINIFCAEYHSRY